jgi:hypothetical protein
MSAGIQKIVSPVTCGRIKRFLLAPGILLNPEQKNNPSTSDNEIEVGGGQETKNWP